MIQRNGSGQYNAGNLYEWGAHWQIYVDPEQSAVVVLGQWIFPFFPEICTETYVPCLIMHKSPRLSANPSVMRIFPPPFFCYLGRYVLQS
jgi:hypothetical protein